jgi:phosphatidylglycerol:prolipoprotein diacylglycerol transferase
MGGPLVAIKIGPVSVYWYGIIIVTGVLLGAYIASAEARRRGEDTEHVWDALILVVITAIVGARLYHVFSSPAEGLGWAYYRENPVDVLFLWNGGLAIFGAFAGGVVGVLLYAYWRKLNVLRWLDIGVPGLLAGQVVGRWGNFLNQELYGPPTTLPWGIPIDQYHRISPYNNLTAYPLSTHFHPVFLYESLWNLVGLVVMLVASRRLAGWLKEGDLLAAYMVWYPLGRLWVEALRPDAWMIGQVATAQVISLVLLLVGVGIMAWNHRPR